MARSSNTTMHGLSCSGFWCACLACYTAFTMMARLYAHRSRYPWVIAAAVVTGCGAWATHSIVLLAFRPGVPVAYDVGLTVISGLIAVAGCGTRLPCRAGNRPHGARRSHRRFRDQRHALHRHGGCDVPSAGVRGTFSYFEIAILTGASFGAAAVARAHLTADLRGRVVRRRAADRRGVRNIFHRHGWTHLAP